MAKIGRGRERAGGSGATRRFFVNKLSDAMQEASETQTWLEFSLACGTIDQIIFDELFQEIREHCNGR